MKTYKVPRRPYYGYPEGRIALTQQCRYANLTRNSFYNLFPAKGFVSYRQMISNQSAFVQNELAHSLTGAYPRGRLGRFLPPKQVVLNLG